MDLVVLIMFLKLAGQIKPSLVVLNLANFGLAGETSSILIGSACKVEEYS